MFSWFTYVELEELLLEDEDLLELDDELEDELLLDELDELELKDELLELEELLDELLLDDEDQELEDSEELELEEEIPISPRRYQLQSQELDELDELEEEDIKFILLGIPRYGSGGPICSIRSVFSVISITRSGISTAAARSTTARPRSTIIIRRSSVSYTRSARISVSFGSTVSRNRPRRS